MQTSLNNPAVAQTRHAFHREALSYLKDFGPLDWNVLYVRFNADRSGDIGPALQALRERKYIKVGSDKTASITALGMAQLKSGAERGAIEGAPPTGRLVECHLDERGSVPVFLGYEAHK